MRLVGRIMLRYVLVMLIFALPQVALASADSLGEPQDTTGLGGVISRFSTGTLQNLWDGMMLAGCDPTEPFE